MFGMNSRNRWLDVLRAMAVVLVVNCHIAVEYGNTHGSSTFLAVLGLGGHGVDLFFVLSGWLLGHILFKELAKTNTIQLSNFFRRRWLRTLPAYYAVLCLTFLQAIVQQKFELRELSFIAFLQTYVYDHCPIFAVTWSLCVEEHFYLLIAPLLLWIGKSNPRGFLVFAVLLLLPSLFRFFSFFDNILQTHVRLDQCAAGVALAFIHTRFPQLWKTVNRAIPILATGAIALCGWAVASRYGIFGDPPLEAYTAISCIAVILASRGDWWANRLYVPGAYYVATRSYSMYLIHVEAIAVARRIQNDSFFLLFCMVWPITALLAEILYRCVELPFMRMRDATPQTATDSSCGKS